MKAEDIRVGEVYNLKIAKNVTSVKISSQNPQGGWDAVNVTTGKEVHIKSSDRLYCPDKREQTDETNGNSENSHHIAKGPRGESQIAGALKILAEAGQPLSCKEIVDRMIAGGIWSTKGATPANTLYSAILREINAKGETARFRKLEKGKFVLADIIDSSSFRRILI